jgi:RNA polymerase sigma-70 factor (ECF subfamily)
LQRSQDHWAGQLFDTVRCCILWRNPIFPHLRHVTTGEIGGYRFKTLYILCIENLEIDSANPIKIATSARKTRVRQLIIRMTNAHKSNPDVAIDRVQPIDWSKLLVQHGHWLRTVIFARLGGHEGVDEVLQEVSLAAVRQRAPLADQRKVLPWLYRLAVLQALLYRRRHGRQRKLLDRYVQRWRPSDSDCGVPDPLVWLLADERRRMVRNAMCRLSPRDAEILLLKYTEDCNYHDLSARLGISHAAVETRLHRARARLRKELQSLELIEVEP